MFDPKEILEVLNKHQVEYILIGGVAATLHSCPEQTYDVDILYNGSIDNKERLLNALKAMEARWDLPLTAGLLDKQPVFALNTKHGDLDIFSHVPGIGCYDDALKFKETSKYNDVDICILNVEGWIKSKEQVIGDESNPRKRGTFEYMKALKMKEDISPDEGSGFSI